VLDPEKAGLLEEVELHGKPGPGRKGDGRPAEQTLPDGKGIKLLLDFLQEFPRPFGVDEKVFVDKKPESSRRWIL
jgi:hypothetical protein